MISIKAACIILLFVGVRFAFTCTFIANDTKEYKDFDTIIQDLKEFSHTDPSELSWNNEKYPTFDERIYQMCPELIGNEKIDIGAEDKIVLSGELYLFIGDTFYSQEVVNLIGDSAKAFRAFSLKKIMMSYLDFSGPNQEDQESAYQDSYYFSIKNLFEKLSEKRWLKNSSAPIIKLSMMSL